MGILILRYMVMSENQRDPQYKLRWPEDLRQKVVQSAKEHNRSMNADIVARLEQSFEQPPSAELSPTQLEQITKAAGASYMAVIAKHLESLSEEEGNKVLRNIVKEAAEDFDRNKKAP